ncbi:DUF2163 domain-containing protein [Sphingomonas turrisvirgatae]|uniref:Bacteriophage phiJL001 Gp84 C-terminal domain-containing protein n=1 Tax=Sphingomonas turrisvirgatae TaxID=1888892 RepID=A0A1E3LTF8_9SPHN|nr:DUF2163 domain-containing protein [Sphingomonas turrisvirgatae]ODP37036.1 hypothetical protein BFL28_19150 [Sphingomonas turrisvirgatae]
MSWLDEPLATIALCWRIDRRDGVTIGLTAHDRDLTIDELIYRASPGVAPSAIKRSASFDADSMDMTGTLTGAAISERDLLAGRWDGAQVTLFAADWCNPAEHVSIGTGTIGAVETRDGALTAELRGAAAALAAPVTESTSPECRAMLGDRRCRVAMAGRTHMARVERLDGTMLTLAGGLPASDVYAGGSVRWLTGPNSGLEDAVSASDTNGVTLRTPPRFAATSALIELREGCDKSIATCANRFGNAANFRGEPYLPGIDLLTRYPGA